VEAVQEEEVKLWGQGRICAAGRFKAASDREKELQMCRVVNQKRK